MAKVIDDSFMVCSDCLQAIANNDYTGLDYYYSEKEADKRMQDIQKGVENAGGYICCGDSEKDNKFSRMPCECCGEKLHGNRHHCVVLEENNE